MKKITIIAFALLSVLAAVSCKKDDAPAKPEGAVVLDSSSQAVPFWSSSLTYSVTSNCDWTIDLGENSQLTVEPLGGVEGTTDITVTLPDNKTSDAVTYSFTVVFKNTADEVVNSVVNIEQPKPSVELAGVSYGVAYLKDGKYWMTENLRYVPEGVTVSDNAENLTGVYYPLTTDGTNVTFDKSAVATAGYLYSADVAFGEAVTADNYDKLAKARGICPEGWHIPDFDDWFGLIGKTSNGKVFPDNAEAPYYDLDLKSGSIAKAGNDGVVFPVTGMVSVANAAAENAVLGGTNGSAPNKVMNTEYVLGSSAYQLTANTDGSLKNIQYYSLMTNRKNGTLNVAYSGYRFGCAVRCVKD